MNNILRRASSDEMASIREREISVLSVVLLVTKLINEATPDCRQINRAEAVPALNVKGIRACLMVRLITIPVPVQASAMDQAASIAVAKIPVWMFGGGRDQVIKPHWLYETVRALEEGHSPALRFTVHENMNHDAWKRVYEGNDLFDGFLRYTNQQRPEQEKSLD